MVLALGTSRLSFTTPWRRHSSRWHTVADRNKLRCPAGASKTVTSLSEPYTGSSRKASVRTGISGCRPMMAVLRSDKSLPRSGSSSKLTLMCLAVPGKIVSMAGDDQLSRVGKVDFGGVLKEVSLAYVPDANIGDYVVVHVGFAISRLDESEAGKVFEYLREMDGGLVDLKESGP